MNAEEQVQMAAKLYECRRTARTLLGDRYKAKIQPIKDGLIAIAARDGVSVLSAAIAAAKRVDGLDSILVLAAAVEIAEPSP